MYTVYGIEQVVEQHQQELRAQYRSGRRRPRRLRPGTRRERLGWSLVELGLRLALPAGRPERS